MISEQEQQLPSYECIMEVNRVEKNIYQCLAYVETALPKSIVSHARCYREKRRLSLLEQSRDILVEVMNFLYPIEWGKLAQTSHVMADLVGLISEHSISSFLPPHLLLNPLKQPAQKPEPYTIDEFRVSDPLRPEKSWTSTYRQLAATPVPPISVLSWGPNMKVYQRLITMDVSGVWRVNGTCTNGDRYFYTMKLQQIGPRRGPAKLEAYVEGEVRLSESDIMVIGGKIDANMAVFHEMILNSFGSHPANVVSAVISDEGQFMSGAWLQHDPHVLRIPSVDEQNLLIHQEEEKIDHHYPLRFLCSGIFKAEKHSNHT